MTQKLSKQALRYLLVKAVDWRIVCRLWAQTVERSARPTERRDYPNRRSFLLRMLAPLAA